VKALDADRISDKSQRRGHPNLHHFGDWLQEASKTLTHAGLILMSQRRDQPMESKSATI
jgi:hypothetical protein